MKKIASYIPFLFLIAFIAHPAFALSCIQPSLERELTQADIVFHGSVLKVEGSKVGDTVNKITVLVETPILNVEEGDLITIYHHHWMQRSKDWEETDGEERHGIFALKKIEDTEPYFGTKLAGGAYVIGMCESLYFEETKENLDLLETLDPASKI